MTKQRESRLVACLAGRVMGCTVGESKDAGGHYPFFSTRYSYLIQASGYGTVWNPLVRIEDAIACSDKFQRDFGARMVIGRRPEGRVCVSFMSADYPGGRFQNDVPESGSESLLGVFTGVNLAEVISLAIEVALGSGGCEQ